MLIYAQVENGSREKRRSKRLTVRLEGMAASERTGRQADVAIRDLSVSGLVMEAAVPFAVGEKLGVRIADTLSEAEVVWCSGRFVGCRFVEPLSKPQLSAALLRSQPVGSEEPAADSETHLESTRMRLAKVAEELAAVERVLLIGEESARTREPGVSRDPHEEHYREEDGRPPLAVRAWTIITLAVFLWVLLLRAVALL